MNNKQQYDIALLKHIFKLCGTAPVLAQGTELVLTVRLDWDTRGTLVRTVQSNLSVFILSIFTYMFSDVTIDAILARDWHARQEIHPTHPPCGQWPRGGEGQARPVIVSLWREREFGSGLRV